MTLAHTAPAVSVEDVDDAIARLRERGLRASAARRIVLEALFLAERPLTAEEVAEGIPGRVPRSDLASVYRNLETLEEVGLVRHVHLGHGPGMYALAGDHDREYLVCASCGVARAVSVGELAVVRDLIWEQLQFAASFQHFPIVGRCATCNARESNGPKEGDGHV
jgi:Fur family transcriptional regulator, ferric uptake regulator